MAGSEEKYLENARSIFISITSGYKQSRTGVDTISDFGSQTIYDLSEGFPLFNTKPMPFKLIVSELLWFFSGSTNIRPLLLSNVPVWNDNAFQYYLQRKGLESRFLLYSKEWHSAKAEYLERVKFDEEFAEKEGILGRVYGEQWKAWRTPEGKKIDQISYVLEEIARNPNSRRAIVSAWNPGELDKTSLPCCCSMFQLYARDGGLDMKLYQRSADKFLGEPWNIASHALMVHIFAQQTGLQPGRFIHSLGDAHFYCGRKERGQFYANNLIELKRRVALARRKKDYLNIRDWINQTAPPEREGEEGLDHVTGILEQLSRYPTLLPKISVARKPIDELTASDFEIIGYECTYKPIRRRMAV